MNWFLLMLCLGIPLELIGLCKAMWSHDLKLGCWILVCMAWNIVVIILHMSKSKCILTKSLLLVNSF